MSGLNIFHSGGGSLLETDGMAMIVAVNGRGEGPDLDDRLLARLRTFQIQRSGPFCGESSIIRPKRTPAMILHNCKKKLD